MKNKGAMLSIMMTAILANPMGVYAQVQRIEPSEVPNVGIMVDGVDQTAKNSEISEAKLTEILTNVKKRITIHDKDADFNYSVGLDHGQNQYTLNWDTGKSSQQIRYADDNNIYAYNYYTDSDYAREQELKKLPNRTPAEIQKIAEEFLAQALPTEYKNFKIKRNLFNRDSHNLDFTYSKNGIPVENVTARINISDTTGQVMSYYTSYNSLVKYETTSGVVSKSAAETTYKAKMGLKKIYTYGYNHESKAIENVQIAYVPRLDSGYAINAKTGVVEKIDRQIYMENSPKMMDEAGGAAVTSLTPEEIKKIQQKSGLKTMEQAQAAAMNTGLIPKGAKLTDSNLYERTYDEAAQVWGLSFTESEDYYSIEISAKDLELLSFNSSGNYNSNKEITVADIEKAKTAANKFIEKFGAKYQDKIQLDDETKNRLIGMKSNTIYLNNVRFENDAYVMNNGISLTYDIEQEKIVTYNVNWTKINLPKYSKFADESIVFDQMFKENKLELTYKISQDANQNNTQAKLYYSLQGDLPLIFSAETGQRIQQEKLDTHIVYSDIDESQYKEEINALAELGIGFTEGKLSPKAAITQKEFLDLLLQTKSYYYPMPLESSNADTKAYEEAGLLLEGEKLTNNALTKQEATKYLVRAAGYEKVAKHSEIFTTKMPDIDKADTSLKGYIVIANTLGLTDTAENTSFNPKGNTSREVGLKMIHNYLALQ